VNKAKTPAISPDQRARLADHFARDVSRLRSLTGMPFSEWQDFA
jgi:hypothetical protein